MSQKVAVNSANDLSVLSKKLNQKTDELNSIIESINKKLESLNFGLEVWYEDIEVKSGDKYYDEENDEHRKFPRRDVTLLGYCRVDHEWELCVKDATYVTDYDQYGVPCEELIESHALRPLLKASRQTRVNAMQCIPGLLTDIGLKAQKALKSIEDAAKAAANF
jgi:hypothetical protein